MDNMTLDEAIAASDGDTAVTNNIFLIDSESRTINVPPNGSILGVETDNGVERKYFKCPRIVGDNIDLSKHKIYVSYIKASNATGTTFVGEPDSYYCDDMAVDDTGDYITFSWCLSGNVLKAQGYIAYKVVAKHTDGDYSKTRWNTRPAIGTVYLTVPDGEPIEYKYPDIVTQLLDRMDAVEEIATPEAMQGYVNDYLGRNPVQLDSTLTDPEKAAPANMVGELRSDLDASDDLLHKIIEPVENLVTLTTVKTSSDLIASIDGNDTISVSGASTGTAKVVYFYLEQVTLLAGTYYFHKDFVGMGGISLRNTANTQIANVANTALSEKFTLEEEQTIKYIQYTTPSSKNISIIGGHIWLVKDTDKTYKEVSSGRKWTLKDNYVSAMARQPIFAWVDDDGIMVSTTAYGIKSAKAVADALGVKCTFAVCSKYFEQFAGTVDYLLTAQEEGFQITNHSSNHTKVYWYPSEGDPDVSNCRKELLTCRKVLNDNGFINVDDFVFPGGTSEDENLIAMVSDYCRCGCMAGNTDGTTHIYGTGRYKIKRCFIRPTEYQGYTLDEYKSFIDNAITNGDMMVFGTHSGIQEQWDSNIVTSVLQYVIDRGYDVVTLNRAINQRMPVFTMGEMLET